MSRRTRGNGTGDGLTFFSLIVVLVLGAALALVLIFGFIDAVRGFGFWVERIAIGAALVIPIILSYREARARRRVWFVLWVIAVILIVVLYILLMTGPRVGWWSN